MIHTPGVNLTVCCSTFLTLRPPLPSFSFSSFSFFFFFYSLQWLSTTPRKWEWSCCLQLWVIHTVMHRDGSYTSELLKDSESRREMCSLREEAIGLVSKNDQNASCLLTCQPRGTDREVVGLNTLIRSAWLIYLVSGWVRIYGSEVSAAFLSCVIDKSMSLSVVLKQQADLRIPRGPSIRAVLPPGQHRYL